MQNCKAYAKKVIQYLPPIGWMWKFSEFVFLERSFDKDKEIIKRQITELCDYPDPVWVSYLFDKMIVCIIELLFILTIWLFERIHPIFVL